MKNILDEREAQVASKAAQWGLWTVYLVLLPSVVVKAFVLQMPLYAFGTEAAALILSGVVQVVVSGRGAVFDSHIRPSGKNYLLLSLIPALLVAVPGAWGLYGKYPQYQGERGAQNLLLAGGMMFVCTFVLSIAAFAGYGAYVKRREEKLSRELEDEEEL